MIISIYADHPEPRKIKRAVDVLSSGGVIAYPTDTIYGLACALGERGALDRLYELKGMERTQPLSLVCPDLSEIARYAHVDNQIYRLLKRLLPGPYCFILAASREVPKILQSKRRTVGMRIPKNEIALSLARTLGRPLLTTSAVPKGAEPLIDPRDINAIFPSLDLVLDGGYGGVEPSTIVDVSQGDI
jgi:tRNA threonylcarbamoyl adenosine modification protein (Sua5/YciO/YrdC/YwlC family)